MYFCLEITSGEFKIFGVIEVYRDAKNRVMAALKRVGAVALSAALPAIGFTVPAAAQLDIGDRFSGALEGIYDGIDIIWPDDLKLEGLRARIGVGFGVVPDYVGSNDYDFRVIPLIDIRYKDRLRLDGSLLTYALYKDDGLSIGPLLNLALGRPQSRNPLLEGIRDIDTTFEAGVFARYQTKAGQATINLRKALGDDLGWSVRFNAAHGIYKSGDFLALASVRGRWLSDQAMQRHFGITEAGAQTSEAGLPAFRASSGVSDASIDLVGALTLSERTRLLSLVSYGHLFGDAADSPLVRGPSGSRSQIIFGIGFTGQF